MKKHIKNLHHKTKRIVRKVTRRPSDEDIIPEKMVPRITNDTIAEHREEVLAGARKYIYPLQHSKHRIVLISTGIFIGLTVLFVAYCTLALYKFQTSSTFIYRVTQVVPFPIAHSKAGFVSYESYLFELRHYMHYYETQQKLSFKTDAGQQQLANYKKQALDRVISDSYIKQLADEHDVSVTNQEVDAVVATVRSQNRLGTNDKVFEDVLKEFWGWSINDFKRSLRQQLLAQKVVSKLDSDTHSRAETALAEIQAGTAFTDVAKKYSEDEGTKAAGGDFGLPIDKTNRDLTAETVDTLYKLTPGQVSGIVDIGYGLEIIKNYGNEGDKIKGGHILFKFKDISEYLNPLKEKEKSRQFVRIGN